MNAVRLALRRGAARVGVLAAVCAAIAVVVAGLTATLGWAAHAERRALQAAVDEAPADAGAVWFRTPLADDAERQRRAVDRVVDEGFGSAVRVVQSLRAGAVSDERGREVLVASIEGGAAASAADLVDGRWPERAGEGTVQADAAEALGLATGDVLRLTPPMTGETDAVEIQIVGVFAPDAGDPTWAGWSAAIDGTDEGAVGPVLVNEATVAAVDDEPLAAWTLAPRIDRLDRRVAASLRVATAELGATLDEAEGVDGGGIETGGGLAALLDDLAIGSAAVAAVTPVPVLLVVIVGWAAIAQVLVLLAGSRDGESALLRARGLSSRQVATFAAVETSIIAVAGAALGVALAACGALLAGGPGAAEQIIGAAWPWPAAVLGVAVATAVVIAVRRAHAAGAVEVRAGRRARAATIGTGVLVLAAAALAVWQLRRAGTPLVATADGGEGVDPIAAVAPALALVAGAVVVLLATGPVAQVVERMSRRRLGLSPALPARQVARGLGVLASAVLLVAVASGAIVVASAYDAGWARLSTVAADLRTGTDVRLTIDEDATAGSVAAAAAVPGVDGAAAVLSAELEVGGDPVSLLAVPAGAVETVLPSVENVVDPDVLSTQLARASPDGSGLGLPAQATGLVLEIDAAEVRETVRADLEYSAWLRDGAGSLLAVDFVPGAPAGPALTVEATLPAGMAPWTLLAVDVEVPPAQALTRGGSFGAIRVVSVSATTDAGVVEVAAPDVALVLTRAEPLARHPLAPAVAEPVPVPVVANAAFAERLGLQPGDAVDFRFAGTGRTGNAEIVGVTPVVPGVAGRLALLADADALGEHLLATSDAPVAVTEVWIGGDVSTEQIVAAVEASGALPIDVRTPEIGAGARIAAAATPLWWIGTAATLALAALAVAAVAIASSSARRREGAVLAALGVGPRAQSRLRSLELGAVLGGALVAGLVAGAAVAALVVGEFVRAAVPGGRALAMVGLGADAIAVAAVAAAFAAVLGLVTLVVVRVSTRAARTAGVVLR